MGGHRFFKAFLNTTTDGRAIANSIQPFFQVEKGGVNSFAIEVRPQQAFVGEVTFAPLETLTAEVSPVVPSLRRLP